MGSEGVPQQQGGKKESEAIEQEENHQIFRQRKERISLHGRQAEARLLEDAYKRVRDSPASELVLVHGPSGTGTETLIQQLKEYSSAEAYHCDAKFDQMAYNKPYSVFMQACNQLCEIILESEDLEDIRAKLKETLGPEMHLLLSQVMPGFKKLAGIHTKGNVMPSLSQGLLRLKVVCRSFFNCLCSSKHPIIICVNDLQWADESSLQLIRALISDPNAKHLLIVGAYCDASMKQESIDTYLLHSSENRSSSSPSTTESGGSSLGFDIGTLDIALSNLNVSVVNEMVAELCHKETTKTLELAKAVHRKTDGNPYFVLQYMDLLFSHGMLKLNKSTKELDYNLPEILAEPNSGDDVVSVLTAKVKQLPEQVQAVLHLASYLGYRFSSDVLEMIGATEIPALVATSALYRERIVSALGTGLREGLLERLGDKLYTFSHDSVQESIYSGTTSCKDKELLHLRIGRILLEATKNAATVDEAMLFLAIDNLNRGAAHIISADEKDDLMYLNLEAAKNSAKKATTYATVQYLRTGISLLDDTSWVKHYDLCLEMYSMAADFEHNTGNFVRSDIMVNEVHRNAHSIEECIPVFLVEVSSMGTQGDLGAAVGLGVSILKKLGEPLAKSPNTMRILVEFMKTKLAIKGRSDDELLNLPLMKDSRKLAAMKLLASLSVYAFMWGDRGKDMFMLAQLRMARLSCRYGLAVQSPQGFAGYGIVFSVLDKPDEGIRFGDLATEMTARLEAKEVGCRTQFFRTTMLQVWRQPTRHCDDALVKQYHYGLAHGDTEFAYFAIICHLNFAYLTGTHLDKILEGFRVYCAEMEEFQLVNALWLALPMWQFLEKLRGNEPNPETLRGDIFNYDVVVKEIIAQKQEAALLLPSASMNCDCILYVICIALYFDDFNIACTCASMLRATAKR